MPWTDASTIISARCVPLTNCGSSSISIEPTDEVDQDDDKREELNELILDGSRYEEQVIYEHRCDIDPNVRSWPSLSSRLFAKR